MTYDDRMISRTLVLGGFRDFCDVFALTFKACIKALVLDEGARCIMLCIGKRVHRYFSKVSNVPHFWWPWLMVCSQQQVGAGHTHLSTRGIPLNSSHWKWDPSLWLAQCRHIRDSNSKVLTRPFPPIKLKRRQITKLLFVLFLKNTKENNRAWKHWDNFKIRV